MFYAAARIPPALALLFLLIAAALNGGCQRAGFETRVWERAGEDEAPPVWVFERDYVEDARLQIGAETVVRKTQVMAGLPLEGAAHIEVLGMDGKPRWIAQRRSPTNHLPLAATAELLSYKLRANLVRGRIEEALLAEGFELLGPPRLVAAERGDKLAAELKVDFSRPATGEFFVDTYSVTGKRLARAPAGARFFDMNSRLAQVYPRGPKKSTLAWMPLFLREDDGTLSTESFSLTSQSGNPVRVGTGSLAFALDDTRFDQVQVFYYVEDFLRKLRDRHGFVLPTALRVETHVGYPEKTNAAFYYRQVLRFGAGDGVTYQDLMRDPSIILHEVSHAVIDAIARLEFSGEAGSINEGFADFFAASFLKNPLMGEDSYRPSPYYRRSLETVRNFKQRENKLYADSEIVSSLFWRLRAEWGAEKTELFALRVIARLYPSARFEDLKTRIVDLMTQLPPEDREVLGLALRERGWL